MPRLIPPTSSSSSGLPVDTGGTSPCALSWVPVMKPDKETLSAPSSTAIRRTQVNEEGEDETAEIVILLCKNEVV